MTTMTHHQQSGVARLRFHLWQLWRQPYWHVEKWSAIALIAWSALSLLVGSEFNQPHFQIIRGIADERSWTVLALAVGLSQLGALLWNRRAARAIMAGLASWVFSIVFLNIMAEGRFPPGLVLYAVPICMNLTAVYRLTRGQS